MIVYSFYKFSTITCICTCIYFVYISRNKIFGKTGIWIFTFTRFCWTLGHAFVPIYIATPQSMGIPVAPFSLILVQSYFLFYFSNYGVYVIISFRGFKMSLLDNQWDHILFFFKSLLSIPMFCFLKCLIKFLAHFLVGLSMGFIFLVLIEILYILWTSALYQLHVCQVIIYSLILAFLPS